MKFAQIHVSCELFRPNNFCSEIVFDFGQKKIWSEKSLDQRKFESENFFGKKWIQNNFLSNNILSSEKEILNPKRILDPKNCVSKKVLGFKKK